MSTTGQLRILKRKGEATIRGREVLLSPHYQYRLLIPNWVNNARLFLCFHARARIHIILLVPNITAAKWVSTFKHIEMKCYMI